MCCILEREERVNEKIKLNFTSSIVSMPEPDKYYQMMVWCPMMIKLKENHTFKHSDLQNGFLSK